jgi:hypothetical protein
MPRPLAVGDMMRWNGSLWENARLGTVDASDPDGIENLPYFDVRHYGAVGDGVTDDTAAVVLAFAAAAVAGGIVLFPVGTYLTDAVVVPSNVRVCGVGPGLTVIKLNANQNNHLLGCTGVSNVEVRDLTLDVDRANQTAGHCIRGANVTGLRVYNCELKNAHGYGIGIQDGTNVRLQFSHLWIHDTGQDGIDIKNKDDANAWILIDNVTVEDFGLNLTLPIQAGIDIRGPAKITNVFVRDLQTDSIGIRFREGEALETNGIGGHTSSLCNFEVIGSGGTQKGVYSPARSVQISNGYIKGTHRGVEFLDDYCVASNVIAEDCTDAGFALGADYGQLIGCATINAGSRGIRTTGNNNVVIGGYYLGASSTIINSGADNTFAFMNAPGSAGINESGTGTRGVGNIGAAVPPNMPNIAAIPEGAELTIVSGVVTATGAYHSIDTEANAASDDLDTINGTVAGQMIVLRANNSGRTVVAKDGTGNLKLEGDFSMDNTEDRLFLMSDGTSLYEIARSNNGA